MTARDRLAAALREALAPWMTGFCSGADLDVDEDELLVAVDELSDDLADGLMSLTTPTDIPPCLLDLPEPDEFGQWDSHNNNWFVSNQLNDHGRYGVAPHLMCTWLPPTAARRFAAALLAAANTAEEQT